MPISAATPRLVLRVAWRNVRRNWRHSLAALGTMAVGFVALALFQGYLDELMRSQLELVYSRSMIGDVMVRAPNASTHEAQWKAWLCYLGEPEQRFLEGWIAAHPDEVRTRVRILRVGGMAHTASGTAEFWGWGHDVPEGRVLRRHWDWNTWAGHPLREDEPNGVLLALGLGTILGCQPEMGPGIPPVMNPHGSALLPVERPLRCTKRHMTLTAATAGKMNALEVEVAGITSVGARELDQRMLWMPLPLAQSLAETTSVSIYMIALRDPKQGPRIRAELSQAARQAGLNLEIVDWRDTEGADLLRRGINLLAMYRALVVIVILVIAGAAVLTTMMKTVRERTREVGTLRSLGYRRHHLLAMFAVEAALLALVAGVVGLASSAAITALINSARVMYKAGLMAEPIPLRIGYSPLAYLWGFAFLSVVAIVAALLAARRVTGMRIAEALSD